MLIDSLAGGDWFLLRLSKQNIGDIEAQPIEKKKSIVKAFRLKIVDTNPEN